MTYRGHVKNGTIVLEDAVDLPEGAEVEVTLRNALPPEENPDATPTLYEQLESVIGQAKGLPADLAENHAHYLYGWPKRATLAGPRNEIDSGSSCLADT